MFTRIYKVCGRQCSTAIPPLVKTRGLLAGDFMRILITGGSGYIGSVMTEMMVSQGYEVTVIDNLEVRQTSLLYLFHTGKLKFIYGDVTNEAFIKNHLQMNAYDFIIPLAAVVGFPLSEFKPEYTWMVNHAQIVGILTWKNKGAKIIFPNTNSSYGTTTGTTECTEDSPTNPISTYSITKCEAEKFIVERRVGDEKSEFVVFRLATVFGMSPRMRTDLLVNHFTWKAMHDKSLILFEKKFIRNFIHIRDVGRAFIYAIENWEKMKNQIYNLGHPDYNITKLQLAEMIQEEITDLAIITRDGKKDPDKRNYMISNAKILKTGFKFEYPLDRGIKELIEGYKSMKDTRFKNWDEGN